MSNHPLVDHNPRSDKDNADETPRPPTSDEQLKSFWLKNEKNIYIAILIVVIVVAGMAIFRHMRNSTEGDIRAEYAAAVSPTVLPIKLREFIKAHPDHILTADAQLMLADDYYNNKKYAEAATAYEIAGKQYSAAATSNTDNAAIFQPLANRAAMGIAFSKTAAGQPDGQARLNAILNNTALPVDMRAEAAYHLATIALSAGNADAARTLFKQAQSVAPNSLWAAQAQEQSNRLITDASAAAIAPGITTAPAATPASVEPAAPVTTGTASDVPAINFPSK